MKIAIFNEFYPPDHLGGAERTAQLIHEGLSRRGQESYVLTGYLGRPSQDGRVFRIIPRYNDPSGPLRRLTFLNKARLDIISYIKARKFFIEKEISVVLVRSVRGISMRPVFAAMGLGIPVAFMVPDDWLATTKEICENSSIYGRLRGKLLYNNFDYDHILCPSKYLLERYLKAGFSEDRLSVFPHGVDTDVFRPAEHIEDSPAARIIFVGRLFPNKGLHVLVEAAKELKQKGKDFKVTVLGKGDEGYEDSMKQKVREHGLDKDFAFMGMVSQERLPEYYRGADIAVVPSLEESFGITLIEAMSCALPVVASRIEAIPEKIESGLNGILVEPGDPDGLAGALVSLMEDREKRVDLGKRAREKIIEGFSLKEFINGIESILIGVSRN